MIDIHNVSKSWIALALLGAMCPPAFGADKKLTIERITSLPSITGTAPSRPVWSRASDRVAFLWNAEGRPFLDVWVSAASGGDPRRITDLRAISQEPEAIAIGSDPLGELNRSFRERSRTGVSQVVWTASGDALVFAFDSRLHRVSAEGGTPEVVTSARASRSDLSYSPDGRTLSWIQEGDLWLSRQGEAEPVRATAIGIAAIGFIPGARYNRPERGISSYRWSPDSRYVALEVEDLRNVRKEAIPDYLDGDTHLRYLRRDYPGDTDRVHSIWIYSVESGGIERVPLEDETYRLINAYAWSPKEPPRLLVDQVSEDAVGRWFWLTSPGPDAKVEKLWSDFRETRNSARLTSSLFRSDGEAVLFTADLDGRHRLHSIGIADRRVTTLTTGDGSVVATAFGGPWMEASKASREVFFLSTQKSPYERHVYRMADTGGAVTQVTTLPGVHEPALSPDGARLALLHSNDTTPRELYLHHARGGAAERQVTHSPPAEFQEHGWVAARYVTFPSQVDDATIHGRLLEPPDLDRAKKYPAILGPVYSNTVRNQWVGSRETFQQYLAQHGYLVLQVDIRGSSGYGRKFREDLFLDYGGMDVEDLASGARYLKSLRHVDPDRIGIWGWSYGGLLTSMSLFKKPGLYAAGVAGAPATYLWHALTGQTENIRMPSTHPEVYRKSSSFTFAENLKDPLMIIHGIQDDVVLFKDSVMLAEKLMMLGKDFDFVVLPTSTHSFGLRDYVARFVYRKVAEHFDRHLGSGPKSTTTETSNDR
jgi:dipeptidyl-peptidase-4